VAVALHEVGRVDPGTADRDDDVVGAGIGVSRSWSSRFPSWMTTQRTRAAYDAPRYTTDR